MAQPAPIIWPRIKEILAKYDILFVADEVICGFGRTGEWFGSERMAHIELASPVAHIWFLKSLPNHCAVRPKPQITSSATNRMSYLARISLMRGQ